MKALTLHQPWATLIALGVKTIETRSWSTRYRGPLAIHAGRKVVYGRVGAWYCEPRYADCDCDAGEVAPACARRSPSTPVLTRPGHDPVPLPLGAVVATCNLVDVAPTLSAEDELPVAWQRHVAPTHQGELWLWNGPSETENPSTGRPTWMRDVIEDQRPYGDFTPGRFAWLLADVVALPEPVPAKGRQGLWEWSGGRTVRT